MAWQTEGEWCSGRLDRLLPPQDNKSGSSVCIKSGRRGQAHKDVPLRGTFSLSGSISGGPSGLRKHLAQAASRSCREDGLVSTQITRATRNLSNSAETASGHVGSIPITRLWSRDRHSERLLLSGLTDCSGSTRDLATSKSRRSDLHAEVTSPDVVYE